MIIKYAKQIFIKAKVITPKQAATLSPGVGEKMSSASTLKKLGLDPNKYELVR